MSEPSTRLPTRYAWRLLMPALARDLQVVAVDQRGSFGFYRAWDTTMAQNEQRRTRRLTMPVLAIGGAEAGVNASATP